MGSIASVGHLLEQSPDGNSVVKNEYDRLLPRTVRYRTDGRRAGGLVSGMLHEFLMSNRQALISRCQAQVSRRFEPTGIPAAINHGVPLFLQQLVETLRHEQTTSLREDTGARRTPAPTEIGRSAALHGAELLRLGFSVDQVVHEYGDICQAVTALAVENKEPISTDEFRTLNRCLDNAIADAVTSFGCAGQAAIDGQAETMHQRLIIFASEHQRLLAIAVQAVTAIKTGNIGMNGATGALLDHTLQELGSLTARTVPDIRLASASGKTVSA